MEIIKSEKEKEKILEKGTDPKGPVGHCQVNKHAHHENSIKRREKKGQGEYMQR